MSNNELIQWNGCWERRPGRDICRWIVAWCIEGHQIAGCAGGYSGGGAFQLEKFVATSEGLNIESDVELAEEFEEKLVEKTEDCQTAVLDMHDPQLWEDSENLVLRDGLAETLRVDDDLLMGGNAMPASLMALFDRIGLTARPTQTAVLERDQSAMPERDPD